MATIIKAEGRSAIVQDVRRATFNFDDIAQHAQRYLDDVKVQAAKIIADAQDRADAIRGQAERDGRQAAMQAVGRVLDEKLAKQMETLLPALQQAVDGIRHARQTLMSAWEAAAVHVAAEIAGRVVRRQLPQMPEVPLNLVKEALDLAAGSPEIRIYLNPRDHSALGKQVESLTAQVAAVAS